MSAASRPSTGLPPAAAAALTEILERDDADVLGIVLTGSAARRMATHRSDVDVIVVRKEDPCGREVERSLAVDEIPMTLAELETVIPITGPQAGMRWSFAYAQVLRDTADGRVDAAVRRQAVLDATEVDELLLGVSRLDGFINYAYRALKSHRDGRAWEARLDCAESTGSLLDIIFALAGRVRPYNKYLAWALGAHPLPDPRWHDGRLLELLEGLLDGSERAMRSAFIAVEAGCRLYEAGGAAHPLGDVIDSWGPDELRLLRGS